MNDIGFNDSDRIGKIGEEQYKRFLDSMVADGKICSYVDLRANKVAEIVDCDFATCKALKEDGTFYSVKDIEEAILDKKRLNGVSLIEVKTDTRILEKRNFFLEILMHGGPGCFGFSRADKWIYYGINTHHQIEKMWVIKLRDLRVALTDGRVKKEDVGEYIDKEHSVMAKLVNEGALVKLRIAKEYKVF